MLYEQTFKAFCILTRDYHALKKLYTSVYELQWYNSALFDMSDFPQSSKLTLKLARSAEQGCIVCFFFSAAWLDLQWFVIYINLIK